MDKFSCNLTWLDRMNRTQLYYVKACTKTCMNLHQNLTQKNLGKFLRHDCVRGIRVLFRHPSVWRHGTSLTSERRCFHSRGCWRRLALMERRYRLRAWRRMSPCTAARLSIAAHAKSNAIILRPNMSRQGPTLIFFKAQKDRVCFGSKLTNFSYHKIMSTFYECWNINIYVPIISETQRSE